MGIFLQDVRYGLRMLHKSHGFSAVAIITLALGIGANTAIFSAVNAALLRPLPYHDPTGLVWITEIWPQQHDNASVPSPDYTNWSAQAHSFAEVAAYDGGEESNLTGAGEPERIAGVGVTPNFFHLLGVEPALGRTFLPREALPGGPPVVILSHLLWERRFGADPNVLGRAVTLDDQKYTVIGVMPAGFRFPDQDVRPEVFSPFQLPPHPDWYAKWLQEAFVIGRLKPGTTPEQAGIELAGINQRDFAQVSPPFVRMGRRTIKVEVVPLRIKLLGDTRSALLMLLGAVGFVLLIACANVANLQLVRTATRQQEFAVRAAIGADRARLVRQLLTESALLAVAGGAGGLMVAASGIHLFRWLAPPGLTDIGPIMVDNTVLIFTLGVTCLVTILFGTLPALAASRPDINETLKHSGLRVAGERGGRPVRKVLASAELAIALVLLAGSGLLLRSFVALSNVDPGFDPHRVLTARINLPQAKYSTSALKWGFLQQLMQRVSALPGVTSVGTTSVLPLSGYAGATGVRFEGQPSPPPGAASSVPVAEVSPDYFRAMGIPLIAGRFFTHPDGTHQDFPLIVNRSFAQRFFPNQDAVGKRVRVGAPDWPWRTVVGVVGDIRQVGISQPAEANIYRPYASPADDPLAAMEISFPVSIVVRSKGNPLLLAAGLRHEVAGIDPNLPVSDIATMEQRLGTVLLAPRFNTMLLSIFAGFALLLATIGIYGVIGYFVSQRTHEIGIRMALGAMPNSILRLVMGEAVIIVLIGLAMGLAGALAVSRYLTNLLFHIQTTDPLTFVAVCLIMVAVAAGASYLPARRAMRVNSMVALKYE